MDTRKLLGRAAVAVLLVALWLLAPWSHFGSSAIQAPTGVVGKALDPTDPHEQSKPTTSVSAYSHDRSQHVTAAVAPTAAVSYKQEFRSASDYLAFARSILAAAQAGNSDAQYYLWAARFACDHDSVSKFGTLDEAEQYGARWSMSMEEVHKNYSRCHNLRTQDVSDLGDQWDWLNRAIKAGQPNAEATGAQLRIEQERAQASPGAGHWLPQAPVGEGADPHQMALKALQSGDAGAWLQIAQITNYLNPRESHQETLINRLAWTVLACQRMGGCPDCGRDCDTTNLMSQAGNNWGAVQQRAQEIGDRVGAQEWDQLGLGFSTSDLSGGTSGP